MYDFYIEEPQHHLITYKNKPFLEKGAKKPKTPPPPVSPVQANLVTGDEEAMLAAKNRKGLRSTILTPNPNAINRSLGTARLGDTAATTTPATTMNGLGKLGI